MLDRPARFIICDGDLVEAKNLDRQNFVEADLGENKARVLSERYSAVLGMETEYVPNFIETLSELMTLIEPGEWETDDYPRRKVREMVLLLGCVDNNRTRQLCHEAFKKSLDLTSTAATAAIPARWSVACGKTDVPCEDPSAASTQKC